VAGGASLLRLMILRFSKLWEAAERAVTEVEKDDTLQQAASLEARTSFCPRCGQRGQNDRRFEEAREIVYREIHPATVRSIDVDLALTYAYWRKKVI
jgi:hypothetical protein